MSNNELASIDKLVADVRGRPHSSDLERLLLALDKVIGDNDELRYRLNLIKMAGDGHIKGADLAP